MPHLDVTQEIEEHKFTRLLRILLSEEIEKDPQFTGRKLLSRDPHVAYAALQPIVQKLNQNPTQHYKAILKAQKGDKAVVATALRSSTVYDLFTLLAQSLRRNAFPDLGTTYDHLLEPST